MDRPAHAAVPAHTGERASAGLAFTKNAMRALDRHAIERLGIPPLVLMEHAAIAVAHAVLDEVGGRPAAVLAACGSGNNGGDGLAACRLLTAAGAPCRATLTSDDPSETSETGVQLRAAEGVGVETAAWGDAGDAWLAEANIVIDAMFGTGLSRAVEGSPARAIDAINAWRRADGSRRVVAVDVPSGMDADTGEALEGGPCVHADATVTLGGIKKGLASRTGAPLAGRVTVGELALPRPLLERFADA